MVSRSPANGAARRAHVSAFLCGTFALALGLVLVLDPDDDDDDQQLLLPSASATEAQAPRVQSETPKKKLKPAKPFKLRAKKTALKKRGKRVHLRDDAAPSPSSQRPRRGLCELPSHGIAPAPASLASPGFDFIRLGPGAQDSHRSQAQARRHLIRGPPPALLV